MQISPINLEIYKYKSFMKLLYKFIISYLYFFVFYKDLVYSSHIMNKTESILSKKHMRTEVNIILRND